jgi:pyrroline-5-carboxylate reductase
MGGALLRGWLASKPAPHLCVREPQCSAELATLLLDHGIDQTPKSSSDVMVLAVKPQIMDAVLDEVASFAGSNTVILSVAAGRTVENVARHFGKHTPIVRCMPNLPAEVGRGITAAFANSAVSAQQRQICEKLLLAVGDVVWVDDESLIDVVTAVSGSGPAYVFYLTECLAEAAIAEGLSHDIALQLARATVTGAGELLHRSPLPVSQLRENVTSPNGTTAAGLSILMGETALKKLMIKTVAAAARRSRELSG